MKVVHVLRKPCSEVTVAANVLRWGTGALHIDASRVGTTDAERAEMLKMSQGFAGRKWGRPEIVNYGYEESMPTKTVSVPSEGGRWPANLVLQHLDGCRCEGTKEIRVVGCTANTPHTDRGMMLNGSKRTSMAHYATKGRETVAAWTCAPGCPVAALDAQSGVLPARGNVNPSTIGGSTGASFRMPRSESYHHTRPALNAPGGASRFFRQFHGKARE